MTDQAAETAPAPEVASAPADIRAALQAMTAEDLRNEVRAIPGLRIKGTKAELVERLMQAGFNPGAQPAGIPEFTMPGEDASREELTAAFTAEAERHRARLQAAADFARRAQRNNTICYGGEREFLRVFSLPENGGRVQAEHGTGGFEPDDFTDAGLRRVLQRRYDAHEDVMRQIRDYAIQNRRRFTTATLNKGLRAAGLEEYATGQAGTIRVYASFQIPAASRMTPDQVRQYRASARQALTQAITAHVREGFTHVATDIAVSVEDEMF